MFCALNGATESPRWRSHAQIAVTIQLLPTLEAVPPTKSDRVCIRTLVGRKDIGESNVVT